MINIFSFLVLTSQLLCYAQLSVLSFKGILALLLVIMNFKPFITIFKPNHSNRRWQQQLI
jgi:hypothetical protein